jgi:hypothetical protein
MDDKDNRTQLLHVPAAVGGESFGGAWWLSFLAKNSLRLVPVWR